MAKATFTKKARLIARARLFALLSNIKQKNFRHSHKNGWRLDC